MIDKSLKDKAIKIKGRDYVLVADRIIYFNENYKNGSIETEYKLIGDMFVVTAIVTPDLDKPARRFVDHSQAIIGDGMVNKTAALENASTSAVGRCMAYMGIGVIDSVASVDEINKATGSQGGAPRKTATPKQVEWIRSTAARVAGLDNAEDIDAWVKANLTLVPKEIPISKVKDAVDKINAIDLEGREALARDPDTDVIVTDADLDNINLDKVPY